MSKIQKSECSFSTKKEEESPEIVLRLDQSSLERRADRFKLNFKDQQDFLKNLKDSADKTANKIKHVSLTRRTKRNNATSAYSSAKEVNRKFEKVYTLDNLNGSNKSNNDRKNENSLDSNLVYKNLRSSKLEDFNSAMRMRKGSFNSINASPLIHQKKEVGVRSSFKQKYLTNVMNKSKSKENIAQI